MPARLPAPELLRELQAAGLEPSLGEILEAPQTWWDRLPARRRAELLATRGVLVPAIGGTGLRVRALRKRSATARAEDVLLEIGPGAPAGLVGSLQRAWERLRYQPVDGAIEPRPKSEPGASSLARPTLPLLLAAWGQPDASLDPFASELPPEGWIEVEATWANPGLARVVVLRSPEGELAYRVQEPELTDAELALLALLNERLRDALVAAPLAKGDRHAILLDKTFALLRAQRVGADVATAAKLGYYVARNYLGYGRLDPILRDPAVEDVSCNGAGLPIFVAHARHQSLRTNVRFEEAELDRFTIKLAQRGGKLLSVAQPMVDATLPGGSRLQACLGREVTSRGSAFTIRKFREDPLTAVDLIRAGTHTSESMAYLWLAVEMRCSAIVMGATASGKTTTLNCLSQFIPAMQKIVSIEDTREVLLQHENWLASTTREAASGDEADRVSMYDLLRAALRQRPDYLLVGEIRGEEGLTLFQAMSTGHTCYSTMHAGSVQNAVYRLENPPVGVPRVMLTSLDFCLLQGQVEVDGRPARRMLSLTEINGLDAATRNLRTNEVFRYDPARDALEQSGVGLVLDQARERRGWTRSRFDDELRARRVVLDGLLARGERHYRDVARAVRGLQRERAAVGVSRVPVEARA